MLQYTAPSPGLPLVAGAGVPPPLYRQLQTALLTPGPAAAAHMAALSISHFEAIDDASYARILALEAHALAVGYLDLA